MRNTGLDEAQAEIKIARRNINNLKYTITHMAESEERKSLLMSCSPWCHKELDPTEQLNWTELMVRRKTKFCVKSYTFPEFVSHGIFQ